MKENEICTFIYIKDVSIIGVVAKLDFKTNKYNIIASAFDEIDGYINNERFLNNMSLLETRLIKLIKKLELTSEENIVDIVLSLPDSFFIMQKFSFAHNFYFNINFDSSVLFKMKNDIWMHFNNHKNDNTLLDIEHIAYILKNGEKVSDLKYTTGDSVKSINLGLYLLHDISNKLQSIMHSCNLNMKFVMPVSYGMRYGFCNLNEQNDNHLLINISSNEIDFCVIGNLGVEKNGLIQFGSNFIVSQIAKEFNIDIRTAGKFFKLYLSGAGIIDYANINDVSIDKNKLKKVIFKGVEKLFMLINKDIYSNGVGVTSITIDGDLKNLEFTRDIAKNIFDVPVCLAQSEQEDDFEKMKYYIMHGVIKKFMQHTKDAYQIKKYKSDITNKFCNILNTVAVRFNSFL